MLFLLFINDLPKISNSIKTTLFADDTTIASSGNDSDTLKKTTNHELAKVFEWTKSNKLTLNASKTEIMLISNRIRDNEDQIKLELDKACNLNF